MTDVIPKVVRPVDQERCDDCPPERVCAWDCEQGQGVLEIMMGEALAEQARLMLPTGSEPAQQALYDTTRESYSFRGGAAVTRNLT
jgi:hypothetical protein